MNAKKPLFKVSKIWIFIIAVIVIVGFSLIYAWGNNHTEIKGHSNPFASGAPVGDPNLNRPTELSTPVPDFKAPVARGLVGDEKPDLAKDPDGFIELNLPFLENQAIQEGDGFILLARGLKPNSTFTSKIYIDGESVDSETTFDSHSVTTDALGSLDVPFALPTNLSVGKYILQLSNGDKSFEVHFTVIKTGEQHAGV